jgi:protein phosphatase
MEGVVEYLHGRRPKMFSHDKTHEEQVCEELLLALAWARQRIAAVADESPDLACMGTTLTLAYLQWPTAYIAHCGDSRAYVFGGNELVQITDDQSIAQMLADMGAIDDALVKRHPLRNVLGSLLSRDPKQFLPRVYTRRLVPGDQLLLCTDGLCGHVAPERIAAILQAAYHAPDACRELVAAANDAGGTDNITVVLAHFGHRIVTEPREAVRGLAGGDFQPAWEMAYSA